MRISNVAVVGAGIAGLACAAALRDAGAGVAVFDKGARPGGRLATRRIEGLTFNHGAQFATARDPGFAALMERLRDDGAATHWPAAASAPASPRWIGVPSMSVWPRHLADRLARAGASLHTGRHVGFVHPSTAGWTIRHAPAAETPPGSVFEHGGDLAGPFDAVVLAVPAPQAAPLLAAIGHPAARDVAEVVMAPCWATMVAFAKPVPGVDVWRLNEGTLAWAAREGARPGCVQGPADAWTLHASASWSRTHLDRPAAEVAGDLLAAFRALTGTESPATYLAAHRWRHALVEEPLGRSCLWDADAGLGLCGDWCDGPRVEAAWLSGRSLARAMLEGT